MNHADRYKRLFILVALLAAITVSGCGYSRWQYKCRPSRIECQDILFHFSFFGVGTYLPLIKSNRKLHQIGKADTLFYYSVWIGSRPRGEVYPYVVSIDTIQLSLFSRDSMVSAIQQECAPKISEVYPEQIRDSSACYCGPFRVPVPRPDSIVVDQDIVILDRTTGEEIERRHIRAVGFLYEWRRSHLKDLLQGP